ncbi:MAG: hypothetical protein ACPGIJ_09155, partial [Mycobacterium sp.]
MSNGTHDPHDVPALVQLFKAGTSAHPQAIASLSILDVVIPGAGGDFSQGGRRWHHAFHSTPDLPEALIAGR